MAAPVSLRDIDRLVSRAEQHENRQGRSLREMDPTSFARYAPEPAQRPLPEDVEPIYADGGASDRGAMENLRRGAAQGWRGLRAAGHAALGGVAEGFGADEFARNRYADAQHWAEKAAEVAPRIQSYKDVNDFDDAVDYGAGVVGNLTGSIPMIAAGALAARATQGRAPLLQRAAPLVAGTLASMPQEYGDLVQDYKARTGGAKLNDETNARMAGAALASSALQSIVPSAVGGSIARGATGAAKQPVRGLIRTMGTAALKDAGEEALFSTAGEALKAKIMDPDKPLDIEQLKEVAVQSAIGGAAMGGVHGAADYGHARLDQLQQGVDKGKSLVGQGVEKGKSLVNQGVEKGKQAVDAAREYAQPLSERATEAMTSVKQKASGYMTDAQRYASQLPGDIAKRRDKISEMYLNLKNAEDTPAEVKALLEEKFEQARRNPTNRDFAAHVLAAREHMKAVRDIGLGAVQFAQERVSKAFERSTNDADLDAMAEGKPIGDQRAFAEAPPDVAAQLYEANQQAAAEKTSVWVDDLLKRANLSDETRARLNEAARNVKDKATQTWVAGLEKAARAADSLAAKVDELHSKLNERAQAQDGSKQSADYSGSDAAVREVLLPWLQRKHAYLFNETADSEATLTKLGRSLNTVMEAYKNDQPIDQDAMNVLMDVLGRDTPTVLAGVLNKSGADVEPARVENFYRRLNGLRSDMKGSMALRNMLAGFAKEIYGDARTSDVAQIARLVDAYADGTLTRGMGREAALSVEQQLRDGLLDFVGGDEQRFNTILDLAEQRARARQPKVAPESRAMAGEDSGDFALQESDGTDTGGMTQDVGEDGEWRPPVEDTEDIRYDFYGGGTGGHKLMDSPEVHSLKHTGYASPVTRVLMKAREAHPEARVEFVRYSDNPALVEQSPQFVVAMKGLTEEQRAALLKEIREDDRGVVVVSYSNAPETLSKSQIAAMKLDTKNHSRSPSRLEFGEFVADAVKITRGMNNETLIPYMPEDNVSANHRRARAFMAGYAELAREFGVAPELRNDLVIHRGNGAVLTVGDIKQLKFRPPQKTDALSTRELKARDAMMDMTGAELKKYNEQLEAGRVKLQERLKVLREADFPSDSDAVLAAQDLLDSTNRLLGVVSLLMDPTSTKDRILSASAATDVANDHNTDSVTAAAFHGEGAIEKRVDMDGIQRRVSAVPAPDQRATRPSDVFKEMNTRMMYAEDTGETFPAQRALAQKLLESNAPAQRQAGKTLHKVLEHADVLNAAQQKRLEKVLWGKDAKAIAPHIATINDLARIVDHQLKKQAPEPAPKADHQLKKQAPEPAPKADPARRNALLQARADALTAKDDYAPLDTVAKVEAFLKAARASYDEHHRTLEEWSRAQSKSDEDIPNPLTEVQHEAYINYEDMFAKDSLTDMRAFFDELDEFNALPEARQEQLVKMARSLQTGAPRTAAQEVAAPAAPKPLSATEVSGRREALLRRVAEGDRSLLDDVAAEPDPKKLQRAATAVLESLDGKRPSEQHHRFLEAVNERIAELLQDNPSAQYAMATRRYSLEGTGKPRSAAGADAVSDGRTAFSREEIREHIRKVLGDTVRIEFADLAHAGDYVHRGSKLGESIMRISTTALNPMSTAHHESLHAFFAQLREMGLGEVQKVLFKASDSVFVRKQLNDLFKWSPEVQEQLKNSAEERVAYMYQMWLAGKLTLKDRPKQLFERISDAVKRALGIWTNDERALHIMEYFNSGEYARSGIGQPSMVAQALIRAGRNAIVDDAARLVRPLVDIGTALLTTGDSRLRDSGIPALAKIADMVKARGVDEREDVGYLPAARQQRAERLNYIHNALTQLNLSEEQQAALLKQLQTGEKSSDSTVRAAAATVRKFLGDMYEYIKPHVDIGYRGRDYFPRMWDIDTISKDVDGFRQMLRKYQEAGLIHDANNIVASLLSNNGNEFGQIMMRPGAQQFKTRELHFITGADAEPWLRKDLMGTLDSYISQATRRVEFARRFGDDGSKLGALLTEAMEEGASPEQIAMTHRYLEGVGGTLGDSLDPTLRKWMGNAIVYQNLRLLPLAVFSQVIDPMGIVVRGGSLKDAFRAYKRSLKEIPLGLKGKNATDRSTTIARELGVIENAALVSTIGTLYNQGNATGLARKINDTFFRYNLMESTTTSMRVAATEAAMSFIQRHAAGENEHSRRYLAELGLKAEDVKAAPDGSLAYKVEHGLTAEQAARVASAINRWVDGAILRPDAADKPIWMNDPLYMLMSHMKQFTFAFAATTLRRAHHEWQYGNVKPVMALASFVPIMIAGDVVKGLIMGGGQLPAYQDDWELEDWLAHGVERAGLLGVGQYGVDAMQYGPTSIAGPTGEQLVKGIEVIGTDAQFKPFLLSSMPANALYREAFR